MSHPVDGKRHLAGDQRWAPTGRGLAGVYVRPTTGLIASMGLEINTVSALLAALGLAREHGGAGAALAAAGIDLTQAERLEAVSEEVGRLLGESATNESLAEALALGFLAGRVADSPPARARRCLHEPTAFVMDAELVVQAAEGESILRLPWFEDGLFVGRQLPDISEMPTPIRTRCVKHYTAALAGERGRFSFISYGHAYWVDAVPVYGDRGRVDNVLAIAIPAPSHTAAATAYE